MAPAVLSISRSTVISMASPPSPPAPARSQAPLPPRPWIVPSLVSSTLEPEGRPEVDRADVDVELLSTVTPAWTLTWMNTGVVGFPEKVARLISAEEVVIPK